LTRTKALSPEEIKQVIEDLSEPHLSAVGLFASYLRALEEAEEDAWAEANAAQILADFKTAQDGDSLIELDEVLHGLQNREIE